MYEMLKVRGKPPLEGGAAFGVAWKELMPSLKNAWNSEAYDEDKRINRKLYEKTAMELAASDTSDPMPPLTLRSVLVETRGYLNKLKIGFDQALQTAKMNTPYDLSDEIKEWNDLVAQVNPLLIGPVNVGMSDADTNALHSLISQELLPIMEELQALTASKGTGFIGRCVNAEIIMSNDISRSILLQVRAKYYKPVPFNERRAGPAMEVPTQAIQFVPPEEEQQEQVPVMRRAFQGEEEPFPRQPTEAEMRRDLEARQLQERQETRKQGLEDVKRRNLEARRRVEEAEARQGRSEGDQLREELADTEMRRFLENLQLFTLAAGSASAIEKRANKYVEGWLQRYQSQEPLMPQATELRDQFSKFLNDAEKKQRKHLDTQAKAAAASPRASRAQAAKPPTVAVRPSDAKQPFQQSKKPDTKKSPGPMAFGGPIANIGPPQRVPAAAAAPDAPGAPKKKKLSAQERRAMNERLAMLQEAERLARDDLLKWQAINRENPSQENLRQVTKRLDALGTINKNIRELNEEIMEGKGRYRQIDVSHTTKGKQEKGNGRWTDYNGPNPVAVMRSLNGAGSKSFRDTPMGQTNRQTRPVRDYDDLDYNDETNDTQEFGGVANKSEMLATENRMVHMDPEWKGLPKRLNLPYKKVRRGNTLPSDKLY